MNSNSESQKDHRRWGTFTALPTDQGGPGSKLKATAGEYKGLYDLLIKQGHGFIWITDGQGWIKAENPLRETFDHTDYILNIGMVLKGILEKVPSTN